MKLFKYLSILLLAGVLFNGCQDPCSPEGKCANCNPCPCAEDPDPKPVKITINDGDEISVDIDGEIKIVTCRERTAATHGDANLVCPPMNPNYIRYAGENYDITIHCSCR